MDPSQNWKELYAAWLGELCNTARARNSQYQEKAYQRAAAAVNNAEISTETPAQLKKLPGIGDKTVKVLAQRAIKHCKELNLSLEWEQPAVTVPAAIAGEPPQKTTRKRTYIPKYGTTPYHVLVGLRQLEKMDPGMGFGKDAIMRHIKTRLVANKGGQHQKLIPSLTPACTRLASNFYITARNRQYFLEPEGRELANRFLTVEKTARRERGSDISSDNPNTTPIRPTSREFNRPDDYESSTWLPGEYTIKLLLDNREVSTAENRTGFGDALEALGIDLVVLPLSVGDCCWVAEHIATKRRAVLDTIVERKRLDDLVSSIIDGRFVEQKNRLEKSCVPTIVYLIENVGADKEFRERHQQRINTALSQILVYNSAFHLHQTDSQADTVLYFKNMMEAISDSFHDKPVKVIHPNISSYQQSMKKAIRDCGDHKFAIDYDSFLEATQKSRNKTIAQVFIYMLMTITGISAEKAMVIQSVYKTPRGLIDAYSRASSLDRAGMVMKATAENPMRRRINPDLSLKLSQVWSLNSDKGTDTDPDEPEPALEPQPTESLAAIAAPQLAPPATLAARSSSEPQEPDPAESAPGTGSSMSTPVRRNKSVPISIPSSPFVSMGHSTQPFVLGSSSPFQSPISLKRTGSISLEPPSKLRRMSDPFLVPQDPATDDNVLIEQNSRGEDIIDLF